MKIFKAVKGLLWSVVHPSYWLQNYPYNEDWDKAVNDALDKFEITVCGNAEAKIGNLKIWIANYPYAYATPYAAPSGNSMRPSRLTISRVHKAIMDARVKKWIGSE